MKMLKVETNSGAIEKTPTPTSDCLDLAAAHLIFNYLAHHCYTETATSFLAHCSFLSLLEDPQNVPQDSQGDQSSKTKANNKISSISANGNLDHRPTPPSLTTSSPSSQRRPSPAFLIKSMECRQQARKLVIDGRIAEALTYLDEFFPQLFLPSPLFGGNTEGGNPNALVEAEDPSTMLRFRLLCQQFVEMIRVGDASGALDFLENSLNPWARTNARLQLYLQNVVVLLAYANPAESPVAHLLSLNHREELANLVNATILHQQESSLERLLRQCVVVHNLLNGFTSNSGTNLSVTDKASSNGGASLTLTNFLQAQITILDVLQ